MIFLQTGQDIEVFNLLITICPGFAIVVLLFVGVVALIAWATKRR